MIKIVSGRAVIASCLVASCVAVGAARAEEGVAFKNLMGSMGIIPQEKDPIQYRERAPLVLPPKSALPAPTSRSAAANPNWPKDPDVAERRRRLEEQRAPVTQSEVRRMNDNNTRLSPAELQQGRIAAQPSGYPGTHRGDNARDVLYLSPEQLRAGAKPDETAGKPVVDPGRGSLTEPPSGYRRQTRTAAKPDYTPRVDQQALDANPMTWLTRKFRSDDDE